MKLKIIMSILIILMLTSCSKQKASDCSEGQIFSAKDCKCIDDPYGCKGLDKTACEQNSNCYSFSRGGTCSCPSCEIWMEHQCLPR